MSVLADHAVVGTLDAFRVLRRFWSEKPHAIGGLAAMAGFDFQLAAVLHGIVRREASGQGAETFVEVLSDIVERDHGFLVTQAKRTLSSSAFRSALDELWGVHVLATERTPEIVPLLRYRVLAASRTLVDWAGSLERWTPAGADADQLADFRKRVEVDVSPSPRMEAARILIEEFRDADPFARIDRAMSHFLAESGGVLDRVVDEFRLELRALRLAAEGVQRRFGLWGADDRAPTGVVREDDDRRAVRIGERLSVTDLREGRLAGRTVYDRIERLCEERILGERPLYKLPVFWISGRSGCGKSAALLHVASRLHGQDPDRVVLWLGHRPALLGAAVRWAGRMAADGRAVVLVLDDPFTAERQSEFIAAVAEAQAEWEGLCAGAGEVARSPLLLCCGPTEQRATAEETCGGQLEFDGYDMPIETEDDLRELADWYALRTGRVVAPMDGNVLLVQQLFEWTKGSIAEFAVRFRDRIRAFDDGRRSTPVLEVVSGILALNRLYVDYPAGELERRQREDPALESALIRLQELEAHFEFAAQPSGGVRLTHPHLADAIYREWFGRITDRPWRKRHLAALLTPDVGHDDRPPEVRHAPFWAISRLARDRDRSGRETDPALRARIDLIRPELREVLSDIHRIGPGDGSHPFEDLPVWLALDRLLDLRLHPSPTDLLVGAVEAAHEPVRGLRLSCHWLLAEEGPFRDRAVGAVRSCLRRLAAWGDPLPWRDWAPLAMDFVAREGAASLLDEISGLSRDAPQLKGMSRLMNGLAQGEGSERIRRIVLDWLQRTPDGEFGWGAILASLIERQGHCEETDVLSRRLLASGADRASWPRVWSSLVDAERWQPALLRMLGMGWLGLAQDGDVPAGSETSGWDMIWRRLVEASGVDSIEADRLLRAGVAWIEACDVGDERWTRVWPIAFSRACGVLRRDLLAMALRRLDGAPPGLRGWSLVWGPAVQEARVSAAIDRSDAAVVAELERIGRVWLSVADREHLGWTFVFEGLLEDAGGEPCEAREGTLRAGAAWLASSSGEHRSWAHVWLALAKAAVGPDVDRVAADGLTWLRRVPGSHPGWSRVAAFLLENGRFGAIAETRPLVSTWLLVHEEHAGWAPVVASWIAVEPPAEEVDAFRQRCMDILLRVGVDDELWFKVWKGPRRIRSAADDLARSALAFLLAGRGSEGLRASLCGYALALRSDAEVGSALSEEGMKLLRFDGTGRSWQPLWDALTRREPQPHMAGLLDAASERLLRVGASDDRWDRVFLRARVVDRRFAHRRGIAAEAQLWLGRWPKSERWIKVWSGLPDRDAVLDVQAVRPGASVALAGPSDQGAWPHLCASLLVNGDDGLRRRALRLAHAWLRGPAVRSGYGRVWRSTWDAESDPIARAGLVEMGIDALPMMEKSTWYLVFTGLLKVVPRRLEDPAPLRSVDVWLGSEAGGGDGWTRTLRWRERLKPSPWRDAAIVARARHWLAQERFDHDRWSTIWRSAMKATSDAEDLRFVAERWLAATDPAQRGWPYVWRALWDLRTGGHGSRAELRSIGVRWLRSGVGHKDRHLVASRMG